MNLFPTKNEKLITATIIAFVVGLLIGLATKLNVKEFSSGLITLFAAFIGAYSAFLLQNKKQESELISQRVNSGNKAIFQIIRNYNSFGSYKKQFIAPFITLPAKFIAIPPSINFTSNTSFDFDSLAYLFEYESPGILADLAIFQASVESTTEAINQRSYLHINVVQPTLEKAGFSDGQDITKEQLESILGERLIVTMEQNTDQIIEGIDSILLNAEKLISELHEIHIKNFKGHKVLKIGKLKT